MFLKELRRFYFIVNRCRHHLGVSKLLLLVLHGCNNMFQTGINLLYHFGMPENLIKYIDKSKTIHQLFLVAFN